MAYRKTINGWQYIVYRNQETGGRKRTALGTRDARAAQEIIDDYNATQRLDRLGIPSPRKRYIPPLAELFAEYLSWAKVNHKPRTYASEKLHVRDFLEPVIGSMSASSLTPADIERLVTQMIEKDYAPRTINLRLETLRKILRRAVENKLIAGMPCRIRMVKVPDALPRYAYPEDLKDWLQYLDIRYRLRAILSLVTGISDRDLGFVRLDGYDRENALLRYRRPKTTTDIAIPLTKTGIEILTALARNNRGPMLFDAASAKRAFYLASKKATENGGKNITPHMLRHTFASWLASIGVPLRFIQQMMGHKSIKTTERYARAIPEELRQHIEKLEMKLFDVSAILEAPKKGDGRAAGERWTPENREAQATTLAGNKLGLKSGRYVGDYARRRGKKGAKAGKDAAAGGS